MTVYTLTHYHYTISQSACLSKLSDFLRFLQLYLNRVRLVACEFTHLIRNLGNTSNVAAGTVVKTGLEPVRRTYFRLPLTVHGIAFHQFRHLTNRVFKDTKEHLQYNGYQCHPLD